MTVTTLDPVTALVVIDIQQGLAGMPMTHDFATVTANSAALARAQRARAQPVVIVTVDGVPPGRNETPRMDMSSLPPEFAAPMPGLDMQPGDLSVVKKSWGAFATTDLHRMLQDHGVTQIILTGVSTSIGVETTAREAYALGYHVTLATDAMADTSMASHEHALDAIFPRLGESGSTAQILALMDKADD